MFLGHCHDMAESVVGDIPTFAGMLKGKHVAGRSPNRRQKTDKYQNVSINWKTLASDI